MRLLAASIACLLAFNFSPTVTHAAVVLDGSFVNNFNDWFTGGNVSGGVLSGDLSSDPFTVVEINAALPFLNTTIADFTTEWEEGSILYQEFTVGATDGSLSFDWDFPFIDGFGVSFWSLYDVTGTASLDQQIINSAGGKNFGLTAGNDYILAFGIANGPPPIGFSDTLLSINNVSFTPNAGPGPGPTGVPEPTTFALLGFSCGGFAIGAIRKRRLSKLQVCSANELTA